MARHCSLSAKAISLTTRIPAQKRWFSIEPPRCARAPESRRQRTSTFSGNEMVLSESTRLSEEAKAPGCIIADRNQLEATIETSIAPLRKRGEQSVGLHAARQRRLVEYNERRRPRVGHTKECHHLPRPTQRRTELQPFGRPASLLLKSHAPPASKPRS